MSASKPKETRKSKAEFARVQLANGGQRRMMEAVPEADVVITNPIHLAVALKFEASEMLAPTVIAKGSGLCCGTH